MNLILLATLSLATVSCEESAGTGGTGKITGTLMRHFYNDDYSLLIKETPAVDEEVFIVYGDEEVLGDRVFASNTGRFSFDYLNPGTYTIYWETEDSTTLLDEEVTQSVGLELKSGEVRDMGTLVQFVTLKWDDGDASIRGRVKLTNYTNESEWPNLVIKDISLAQEQEVYLTYGSHSFYDERIRTQYDGTFEFNHLIPGDYKIFLYSEDVTGATQMVTIERNVTITEPEQVIDLGEIMIYKH
ncbi:MAG: hypothetical protein JXR52_10935 [Bacteroidales bacterium]|nr:hypothetical protein [Bacteroidales bacterium]